MKSSYALLVLHVLMPTAWSQLGSETAASWADYPQAVFIDDVTNGQFNLGFWASKKYVVGPSDPAAGTFTIQTGDLANSPVTHFVNRTTSVNDANQGRMHVYKVCDPPKKGQHATQSLSVGDYWDYDTANATGIIVYAKNPSKALYSRTVAVLKKSECMDDIASAECAGTQTLGSHEVCSAWDPRPDVCKPFLDASGVQKSIPWIIINGKLQAFMTSVNCKEDGSALGPQLYASVRYSLTEIKAAMNAFPPL